MSSSLTVFNNTSLLAVVLSFPSVAVVVVVGFMKTTLEVFNKSKGKDKDDVDGVEMSVVFVVVVKDSFSLKALDNDDVVVAALMVGSS